MTAAARALGGLDAALHAWLATPRALRWLAVAAVVAASWWSSSRTPTPTEPSVVHALLHNAMHVVAFAVVAATVWFAVRTPGRDNGARAACIAAIVFAVGYGIVDELHQSAVPGRVASAWDVLSDACGSLAGVWLLHRRLVAPRVGIAAGVYIAVASCVSVALATFV